MSIPQTVQKNPPASMADDQSPPLAYSCPTKAGRIFLMTYYYLGSIGLPVFIFLTILYCLARKRLWHCFCYYDVETALESQPATPIPPSPIAGRALPCLPRSLPEPQSWELASAPIPPPERIQEISAACADCAICAGPLDADAGERCSTLPLCGHRFHKVCVSIWLHRKTTCPVCRRFYPFPVRSKLSLLLKQKRARV